MRIDWECARAILLATEALEGPRDMVAPGTLKGFSEEEAVEHIRLLVEAGFIEGYPSGAHALFAKRLTWAGHEFLATLRSKDLWARIKTEAKDRGLALSFDVVKTLAGRLIQHFV